MRISALETEIATRVDLSVDATYDESYWLGLKGFATAVINAMPSIESNGARLTGFLTLALCTRHELEPLPRM